nr:hypothetical protein Iba_chr04eCG18730 [Ipomoea batatas]
MNHTANVNGIANQYSKSMNQYITCGLWAVGCGSAGCGLRDCDSADGVGNWSPKWEGGDGCSEADRRWRLASAGCSDGGGGWRLRTVRRRGVRMAAADYASLRREIRGFRADG